MKTCPQCGCDLKKAASSKAAEAFLKMGSWVVAAWLVGGALALPLLILALAYRVAFQ